MAILLKLKTKQLHILLLLVVMGFSPAFPQETQEENLDKEKVFRNLEEALKTPDQVFHLSLKKKKLTEFPVEIMSLKQLKTLDLSKNKLLEIPSLIGGLTNLEKLDITGNRLKTLPPEIGKLTKLENLHTGMNDLEYLPKEIGQLKQLKVLDIWNNNLESLPVSISDLTNLSSIDMRVIQLNDEEKRAIRELLPESVKILFSNSCDCD